MIALLRGASTGSVLGLLSLLWVGEIVNMLIDDSPTLTTNSAGLYMTLTLSALAAYANLLDQDWARVVNKVIAVWGIYGAVAAVLPDKFKEAWKFGEDASLA